tara:strand:+ start:1339 stop:1575 length:237 start_codon:yes stop_codon:yes gene_type:complete
MLNKKQIYELKILTIVNILYNDSNGEEKVLFNDLAVIRNNEEDVAFGFDKNIKHNDIFEDGTWLNGGNKFFIELVKKE